MNPVSVEATAVPAVERELVPGQRVEDGAMRAPSAASPCAACGLPTFNRLCHFDSRTMDLIRSGRCVACKSVVFDDTERVEGRCAECRSRNVQLSSATRRLLHQAANARYYQAKAA